MRLTSRGAGLLTGAVLLLSAGFLFGYPPLALLGSAAALAVAFAMAHALWQPRLVSSRTADPDRVGRGERCTMTVTVHNRDRLRPANLIAQDRCGGRFVPVPLLRLRPGRDTTVSYPVPTQRRGVVPVGPLRIVRHDPLGLIRTTRSHAGTTQVWVHPRVHPLTAVPAGVARSLDGRLDRVPHGSITFDALREYVVGDELRRVHWRTSARIGELMVREDVDTSLPRIVVLLDNRNDAHPRVVDGVAETFESACEAAASIVAAATRDDLPVSLLLVGGGNPTSRRGRVPPTPSRDTPLDLLAAAELHHPPLDDDPLRTATARLRQQRLGDTLVFLTGPGDRGADVGRVGALRGAYPSVVVGIFGGGETRGGMDGVVIINAADGAEFAVEWNGIGRW